MGERMSEEAVGVLAVVAVGFAIFGGLTAFALFTGKFFNPKAIWFSDMFTDRRKEPVSYWFLVTFTGAIALLFAVGAVKVAIFGYP